ncbi:MAG: DUF177 domain-containing protein [Pseudomonadota bacterium]
MSGQNSDNPVTPELSRLVLLSQLDQAPQRITANVAERAALAERFGLVRLDALSASCDYHRAGDTVQASGWLRADIVQSCVITLEDFPSHIDQPFSLRFAAEVLDAGEDEMADMGDDADYDLMPLENGRFDIGEAVAQTLALMLDPYPRSPEADAALLQKGILREGEEKESPFAALGELKKKG